MALISEIISRAYREQQVSDIAEQPSAAQQAEALPLLQGIILRSMVQYPQTTVRLGGAVKRSKSGVLRQFDDLAQDLPLPHNIHLHCQLASATSVYMPHDPGDGARLLVSDVAGTFATYPLTLLGNGNTINGGQSLVLNLNGQRHDLFYRRDLAEWRTVTGLLLTDPSPFPEEFDDMLVLALATRLVVRYGRAMDAASLSLFSEMQARFVSRYTRVASDVEADVLFDSAYLPYSSVGEPSGRRFN